MLSKQRRRSRCLLGLLLHLREAGEEAGLANAGVPTRRRERAGGEGSPPDDSPVSLPRAPESTTGPRVSRCALMCLDVARCASMWLVPFQSTRGTPMTCPSGADLVSLV
eukprot:scaffold1850_cov194-Pinguiococcus_pyrenoidosus.AAC.15